MESPTQLSCWLICDSERVLNWVTPIVSAHGVHCTPRLSTDKLASDSAQLLTKLGEDKPDLVWLLSSTVESNRTTDAKVQVAAKLIMSLQRSGNRECFLKTSTTFSLLLVERLHRLNGCVRTF